MQTVLITGSSSGFGEASVRRFAAAGWNVIATLRDKASAPPFPEGVLVETLDVTDPGSILDAIESGKNTFGSIDVVVNNAGFGLHGFFEESTDAKMREQFEVNVFGLMEVTRAILPHMRARGTGSIVNVTSGAGVFGLPMISLYAASKFAVEGFSESLYHEVRPFGIRVKLIEPGGVTSTNFGKRAAAEASGFSAISDYRPLSERAATVFRQISESRSSGTSEEVADVILTASTDGSDRLRYVATEGIKSWVTARRETSEEAYMELMRREVSLT